MSPRAHTHSLLRLVAIGSVVLLAATHSARAANRFWTTNGDGAFGSNANWQTTNTPPGGATPPGVSDIANFTRGSAYTVTFAANVTNAGLVVNNDNVKLDLNGRTYTITGGLGTTIGTTNGVTGQLTITDGILGVDTASDRILVGALGSTGIINVTTAGRLGNSTIDPDMIIGNLGRGTLNIEDNGRADVGFLNLGQIATANGTVKVSGPNAVVDTSDVVNVGIGGTGTLTIEKAGTMSAFGNVTLGSELAANGTVKITDFGSAWSQAGKLTIAKAGDAALSVEAAGMLNTAGAVVIGEAATGIGTGSVTGSDSTWNMSSTLQLGLSGLGSILITNGGRATTDGAVQMSINAGSESHAVVSGTNSRWTTGAVTVGNLGTAHLTVMTGGRVDTGGPASIASGANSVAVATVTGTGSAWNITGALTIAGAGTGTLTVSNDASVSATGVLTIGDPAGPSQVGTLNLNGGSITAGGFTRAAGAAFNWTDGTLLINNGVFNNGGAGLTVNGATLSDVPALRLSAGSTAIATHVPNLTIGSNRQGSVIVSGGSSFQVNTASIGAADGGTGALHIEGAGSIFTTTGDLGVGGTTTAAGGLGGVTLGPGGTVNAQGTLRLWSGGNINLVGGTLQFNNLAASGGKVSFTSGTVRVQSNFNANAAALDAILGPAHVLGTARRIETPGFAMNLQSNLTASGGAISGNTLALSADAVARFESGATATFAGGITNPAGARIYATDATVAAGTIFINGGELHLEGSTATVNGNAFNNSGLLAGAGRVNSVITNNNVGQVRVADGKRLQILGTTGNSINNGLIDVDGGEIEFGRQVTNSNANPSTGLIAARDATLRFHSGLLNSGSVTFSTGVSDVFGDVTNQSNLSTPGRIIITGGAQANFFDDVVNNGGIQISGSGGLLSTAVFLGSLSGAGTSGTGRVFLEGDTRPGFSPGTMAFGGDVSFGPQSTLNIELAGTTPGTQYDRVAIAASASLAGELSVSLLNNFKPAIGNTFQIVTAAALAGTFDGVELPALAGGAKWDVSYGAGSVLLSVGGVLGDYNLDGRVDAADYAVWRNSRGTNSIAADASGNGQIDHDDYIIWKANFGAVAAGPGGAGAGATSAVPEPSLFMLIGTIALTAAYRRRTISKFA